MTNPNIITDTTPSVDPEDPTLVRSVITDAWGLFFAQGGVVMAAALRAMEAVLARPDLRLASASAVFCRPVACGPVTTRVEVVRDGRKGSQVVGSLRTPDADGDNVVVTAVYTDPTIEGPVLKPLDRPAELDERPAAVERPVEVPRVYPLGFLDNTEWQLAVGDGQPPPVNPDDPRLAVWFRFTDPPAAPDTAWDPALFPIPGDSLGSALMVALGGGDKPIGSVSLQIGLQVYGEMRGTWIGIDSVCTRVEGGLANGTVDLWSESGEHIATLTQTAMLRSM